MPFEFHRPVWLAVLSIAGMTLVPASVHAAQATRTLYAFCKEQSCLDGSHPSGDLLLDDEQNLFGTTQSGGQNGKGTVYEMIFNAATGIYRHKVIYDFCNATGCVDGGIPVDGTLIRDIDGSLYGTTSTGGPTGGSSGGGVPARLSLDPSGVLTGLTSVGGVNGGGTFYKLVGDLESVFNFSCTQTSCVNGGQPQGGVIGDADGHLFTTMSAGGANDGGTLIKYTPPQ